MTAKPGLIESAAAHVFKTASMIGDKRAGWMVIKGDGVYRWKGRGPAPSAEQRLVAETLCDRLNREIWCDGFWQVVLAEWNFVNGILAYARTAWCYFDADNDLQLTIETNDPAEVILATLDQRVMDGFDGLTAWRENERLNEIRGGDKIRAALGQKSANPNAKPEVDVFSLD